MNNPEQLLTVAPAPHLHGPDTVPTAMRDVLIALAPALAASLYFFGLQALLVILSCVGGAWISELVCLRVMKKEGTGEWSALVTGLLLAFCLPPALPAWMAALGAVFAVVIAKHLFGGLGHNIFNPALIGRAFLLASFPVAMTSWSTPLDGVSTASPLGIMKEATGAPLPSIGELFLGSVGGSIGETSALALLLGGGYLLYRRHIDWRIPGTMLASVFCLTSLVAAWRGFGPWYPFFHLFSGGLMLGAFFMATDWVTSPVTKLGRVLFGIGCGAMVVLIRLKGGYPEGVAYSILLMNVVTPLLDRYSRGRVFGRGKAHA
ncbi:RnfABCDGE type electron transport complex subunit D [Geomonas propionica]|uniref:Ion-translocating oxidoreductase complex subunit D n=1 Tax=Geomonas propionica TaxID=2798582 RepID=A0ABS0YPA0_9BACT|nr:RnfABCDGE type electron transport complex subunit D [Geomonas propionica]MBJ6799797.1 RnfABCDGE type electron transport complex subunit D [Geomonas propionica]